MSLDPNRMILTGENPFIRFSETDGGTVTTNASFWRILISPADALAPENRARHAQRRTVGRVYPCDRRGLR
jgi:hypothetical protein